MTDHSAADDGALVATLRAAEAEAEATHNARVEAAIRGKGEDDCQSIADATGLPLVDIRAAMAAAQRG